MSEKPRLPSKDQPASVPDGWVEIGRIGRPHGVHGAMHLRLFNDDSELLSVDRQLGTLLNDRWQELVVTHVNGGGAVTFDDVKGRESADALKHATVFVRREEFPPLDDDEVYLADLVGAQVQDAARQPLGSVESFDDNGAQPLMQVRTLDRRLIDVPFVGALVVEILPPEGDREVSLVVLDPPEGLFEIDLVEERPDVPRSPRGRAKRRREETASTPSTPVPSTPVPSTAKPPEPAS